ncbi:hypothetical protein JCM31598_30350 [Desulfonatronum parangueonense]
MFPLLQDFIFPHSSFLNPLSEYSKYTHLFVVFSLALTIMVIAIRNKYQQISYFLITSMLLLGLFIHDKISLGRFSFQKYIRSLEIDKMSTININHGSERSPWKQHLGLHAMPAFTGKNFHLDGLNIRVASQDTDPAGFMAFGNYIYIFPGSFKVNFGFMTENCFDSCVVASLDVSSDDGRSILQKTDIPCQNNKNTEKLHIFADRFLVVEPRVYYHGCGDVVLKDIYIEEVID